MAASEPLLSAAPPAQRAAPKRRRPMPWLTPGIYIGAMAPLASILVRASQHALTANPIAEVMNELGLTALVLLMTSLACTPARLLLGWTWPVRIRRDLGLLAFFYATLHFLTYVGLDQVVNLSAIVDDIAKRPFITVGFAALVLLVPLVLTSTKASVQQLGFDRWKLIHRLAYAAGVLAVVHFFWRVKIDLTQPLTYGLALAALLGVRLAVWQWRRRPGPAARRSGAAGR